jgi:hypothetical protein
MMALVSIEMASYPDSREIDKSQLRDRHTVLCRRTAMRSAMALVGG